MPLSQEFLPLFKSFVSNYKVNGVSSFYSWSKDKHQALLSQYLEELFEIIAPNADVFHDTSIIESLHSIILLAAKNNRYLLDCWIDFFNKYNAATHQYEFINTDSPYSVQITANPEGNSATARMLNELQKALFLNEKRFIASKLDYDNEIASLRAQVAKLQTENTALTEEKGSLEKELIDQRKLMALNPEISTAAEQLTSFSTLLKTLGNVIDKKPKPLTSTSSTEVQTEETHVVPPVLISKIIATPPPPPPPLPPGKPSAPPAISTMVTPKKPAFFVEPTQNTGNLLEELAKKLKERNDKGTIIPDDDLEKKKALATNPLYAPLLAKFAEMRKVLENEGSKTGSLSRSSSSDSLSDSSESLSSSSNGATSKWG